MGLAVVRFGVESGSGDARAPWSVLSGELLARELLSSRQSVRCRYGDVRFHSCPFPIRFRDRIDRLCKRHEEDEAIIDALSAYRVSAAASDFADDSRTLQALQVIAEFLCA